MNTEIALALITAASIFIGGLVYIIRKWADWKEKQLANQDVMEMKRLEHEMELEKQKADRERVRQDRERDTTEYLQANTGALQALHKAIEVHSDASIKALKSLEEAFRREVTNGMAANIRSLEHRIELTEKSRDEKMARLEAVIAGVQSSLQILKERK